LKKVDKKRKNNKESVTVAEKEFHKQITDVPILDCRICEKNFFLKYVTTIRQGHNQFLCNYEKRRRRQIVTYHTNNSYI